MNLDGIHVAIPFAANAPITRSRKVSPEFSP
jgi:hypothetical protein